MVRDYDFILRFHIESEEYKSIEQLHEDQGKYPLVFGPIMMGIFFIVKIEVDERSGIADVYFVPAE